jgi:hypothetical protein
MHNIPHIESQFGYPVQAWSFYYQLGIILTKVVFNYSQIGYRHYTTLCLQHYFVVSKPSNIIFWLYLNSSSIVPW